MNKQYDLYLEQHRSNVAKGFYWIQENLPELLINIPGVSYEHQICYSHEQDFRYAWLYHIHRNPHHWQYWVLINDDPDEGEIILDMPYNYIIEMICDWWAFSWSKGNLNEIFDWYDKHKDYMKLSDATHKTVEDILSKIKKKLEEDEND